MLTCVISGTIYKFDGTPAAGATLTVVQVATSAENYANQPVTYTADANGLITMTLERNTVVRVWGNVQGFSEPRQSGFKGTSLVVPNTATATLASVTTALATPNTVPVAIPGGGYVWAQTMAATTWTINHGLNIAYPSVSVYDSSGNEIIAHVTNPTVNQTVIYFSTAQAGYARLV